MPQAKNRSCAAVFGKLRCRNCTATLAFLQYGSNFYQKLHCNERKTALQHRKSCVAGKWRFPAAFLRVSRHLGSEPMFRTCWWSFDARYPREWPPDLHGISVPKRSSLSLFFVPELYSRMDHTRLKLDVPILTLAGPIRSRARSKLFFRGCPIAPDREIR